MALGVNSRTGIGTLRLHEQRLRHQYERDEAELKQLRQERFEAEEAQHQWKEAEGARQPTGKTVAQPKHTAGPVAHPSGFEFTNLAEADSPLAA